MINNHYNFAYGDFYTHYIKKVDKISNKEIILPNKFFNYIGCRKFIDDNYDSNFFWWVMPSEIAHYLNKNGDFVGAVINNVKIYYPVKLYK